MEGSAWVRLWVALCSSPCCGDDLRVVVAKGLGKPASRSAWPCGNLCSLFCWVSLAKAGGQADDENARNESILGHFLCTRHYPSLVNHLGNPVRTSINVFIPILQTRKWTPREVNSMLKSGKADSSFGNYPTWHCKPYSLCSGYPALHNTGKWGSRRICGSVTVGKESMYHPGTIAFLWSGERV